MQTKAPRTVNCELRTVNGERRTVNRLTLQPVPDLGSQVSFQVLAREAVDHFV